MGASSGRRMGTRMTVLMGPIKKHVAGDLVYSDIIGAQHNLQSDTLDVSVSGCFERI
jgi:hypothetical protein